MSALEVGLFVALLLLTAGAAIGVRVAYLQGVCDGICRESQKANYMRTVVCRIAMHELPEASLDQTYPEDFVNMQISHMDHNHYRHTVRLAKELV